MADFTGTIEIKPAVSGEEHLVVGVQYIDNGGVVWTYDKNLGSLTIRTSFFGYGETVVTLPYQNSNELVKFFNQVNNKD